MNAIILAAGLGSRFKDITKHTHKALLQVKEIPNIERTIKYLKEANINDIYIVTGHLSEQFEYLKNKYNCNIIYNAKYKEYNNIYSFSIASHIFGDSYIIDSDVVLFSNVFLKNNSLDSSCYFLIKRPKSQDKEWIPIFDQNDTITHIEISNRVDYSLLGISFWKNKDANRIKKELKNYLSEDILLDSKLYWDNIPMKLLSDLNVKSLKLDLSEAYEMDRMEDYELILKNQS